VHDRVARWHILKPKISKCVNFGGRCWYILWQLYRSILQLFGRFWGH
jgi:hypothetical protein